MHTNERERQTDQPQVNQPSREAMAGKLQIDADGNRTSHRRSQSSRRKPAITVSTRSQLGQDHPGSAYIRGLPRRRPCEDGFICSLFFVSRAFVVRFCAFCAFSWLFRPFVNFVIFYCELFYLPPCWSQPCKLIIRTSCSFWELPVPTHLLAPTFLGKISPKQI